MGYMPGKCLNGYANSHFNDTSLAVILRKYHCEVRAKTRKIMNRVFQHSGGMTVTRFIRNFEDDKVWKDSVNFSRWRELYCFLVRDDRKLEGEKVGYYLEMVR